MPDPSQALNHFISEVRDRPFEWGKWDCLIFTNEAFRRMHGAGWADDWIGRYMAGEKPVTRSKLRREYGYQTIEDALQDRLQRADRVPPRGALVLGGNQVISSQWLGVCFGISVGTHAAFISEQGMVYSPIEYIDSAWVRNDAA